jgi:hypothetical protein
MHDTEEDTMSSRKGQCPLSRIHDNLPELALWSVIIALAAFMIG